MDQRPSPSPETQFKEAPNQMVLITDSNTSVFPPINHENLQISFGFDADPPPSPPPPSPSSSSSSSFSPSSDVNWVDASPPPVLLPKAHGIIGVGLHVLYSRVRLLVSSIPIWSLPRWTLAVAVVVWLYRRRKRLGGTQNQLLQQVIKDKDEKITQLLHRISQMNEVLLARHRVLISKLSD